MSNPHLTVTSGMAMPRAVFLFLPTGNSHSYVVDLMIRHEAMRVTVLDNHKCSWEHIYFFKLFTILCTHYIKFKSICV